jgi:tRNA nucleotidyltransferase (CCA-adding enzyme)
MPDMVRNQSGPHLMQRLPRGMVRLLRELGRLADEEGIRLYLVGGVVRDLLLRRRNWDLDLSVEGDGIAFARLVTNRYGAGLALFERFATARLVFPDGLKVDIASARRESYAAPAALPNVATASLEQDLFRRDFTINAMAIQLNEAQWGALLDPFGGRQDLKNKILRVLHDRSFVDDPTRIFRAIRFAERFEFRIEPNTRRLLVRAANANLVTRLSGSRLANELLSLLNERHPDAAIRRLRRLRLLRFLHPRLRIGPRTERLLDILPRAIVAWTRECPEEALDRPLVWMMGLLGHASSPVIAGTTRRLQLSAAQVRALECAGEKTSRIAQTLSSTAALRASHIYRLLSKLSGEALVLVFAKGLASNTDHPTGRLTRRLKRYLQHDRHVTSTINGEILKRLGLRPGPYFKEILDRLLDERLDGRIAAGSEETARAKALAQQYG